MSTQKCMDCFRPFRDYASRADHNRCDACAALRVKRAEIEQQQRMTDEPEYEPVRFSFDLPTDDTSSAPDLPDTPSDTSSDFDGFGGGGGFDGGGASGDF